MRFSVIETHAKLSGCDSRSQAGEDAGAAAKQTPIRMREARARQTSNAMILVGAARFCYITFSDPVIIPPCRGGGVVTKVVFFKFILPVLVVMLLLKWYRGSGLLERLKKKIGFDLIFRRFIMLLLLLTVLLLGFNYLVKTFYPEPEEYPAQARGGRSGSLPVPLHGRPTR